jgi:flagellar protein FliO/FliZ
MGWLDLLRSLGALLTVLGLLVGALWLVRRYGITLPGVSLAGANQPPRRLQVIERLAIDGRASLTLIRRDGQEHLLLFSQQAALLIESGIPAADPASAPERHPPPLPALDIPPALRRIPASLAARFGQRYAARIGSPLA